MRKIIIEKPKYCEELYDPFFNNNTYTEPEIFNKYINNCFISYNSIVLKNYIFLENDSIYEYKGHKKIFCKKVYEQFFHSVILKKTPLLRINEPAFIITQPWINYYHWILESLPRLIQLKDYWGTHSLIIQRNIYEIPYVKQTLKLFDDIKIIIPENETNLFVKELILPNLRKDCYKYNIELLEKTRDEIFKSFNIVEKTPTEKNFIIRKKAKYRTIDNFREIEKVVKEYGFKIVDFEDYSIIDQIKIINNSSHLIAQHGAGLTNILFMQKGMKIMELAKKITNKNDHFSLVYWSLASAMELEYYNMFCDPVNEEDDFFKASINVNLEEFITILGKFN